MAQRTRIGALAVALLAAAGAVALAPGNASAASLVECETESGFWDCYLPTDYDNEHWYYDGVLLPTFTGQPSAFGDCTPGSYHTIRVTFDGGRSSTSFTCR